MIRLFCPILCSIIAILAFGCATVPDPDPPDLSNSEEAAETRIRSLEAAETSIVTDLDRLEEYRENLRTLAAEAGRADLPLSMLRLVAMNCLNTEYQGTLTHAIGLGGTSLSCRPSHIEVLTEALADVPTSTRDQAHELLYIVDQARILRGTLRQRLSRLPHTVREYRNFIADERAILRQLESDLVRRRNLYSASGWREANSRISAQRRILEKLDEDLNEIIDKYPAWGTDVDALLSSIYFDISDMRSRRDRDSSQ